MPFFGLLPVFLLLLNTFVASQVNTTSRECQSRSCFRYFNKQTAPYLIKEWPLVDFPTGEFYSGSVPIDESDPVRTLFFVFKPATEVPVNETTIWLNGGPGCSSLVGFLQENGPISWQPGTLQPTANPYAWSRITNMLWVEYPVGVGFTTGNITALDEGDISRDFVGFYKNWQKLFGIQDYKTYVTGESYAGRYVPYIAAEMLNQNDTTYFDVGGALVIDGTVGSFVQVQESIPAYRFANANKLILNLNDTFLESLEALSVKCGYEDYMDKYLQFPPPALQPELTKDDSKADCDTFFEFLVNIQIVNPCFSVYDITRACPILNDPLAQNIGNSPTAYFNRTDVREAIHAPRRFRHPGLPRPIRGYNRVWFECASVTSIHSSVRMTARVRKRKMTGPPTPSKALSLRS